uniref:Uncharacterized protein n=1 Tax=Ciona savignyi TaxID=51511 RepID=H2ZCF4_CIOSA
MKTAYMQGRVEQGFVISEVKAVNLNWTDANVVNITLDKTSQHNSLILCAVESLSGTVVKGVLLKINEVLQRQVLKDRREKIGKLVRYGNGSVNRTTPRIRNNDHIIPKIDKNISRCGESPGVPVTLLTPTNTSPVTYEFSLGKSFGEIRQNNADKTIDLYIFKPEDLEENLLYICHTHGPRILHRWSPLSDSNTAVKIQAQSSTQWFLVCLSLSSINEEACGNFTVVPSRGGNVMVMLIVGAVLMGFGTIPLLVAASQHAWHSRQEIAAARLRRTKPLLAKPVKRQLQTQASDNSKDIDSGRSSHILEGPRDANSPSLPIRELYNSKMITSRSNMKVNPTKSQLNGLCSYHSEIYDSGEKEAMLAAPADEDARNSGVQRWLNQVQLENWSEASQRDAYVADGHSVTEDYFDDRLNEV